MFKNLKIKKRLQKMPYCTLKSVELYKIANFHVSKLSEVVKTDYTSFDFSSNIFELRHRTSFENAILIIKTRMFYGCDAARSANFEHILGSRNHPAEEGVNMYFRWQGKQKKVLLAHEDEIEANILFHVSVLNHTHIDEKTGANYWESRLYPGTNQGLFLIGLSSIEDENNVIVFDKAININVITKKEFENKFYN